MIIRLRDIPDGFKLTANQAVQRQAAITSQAHVNPQAISEFLDRLQHPLHFLDFETFGTAIPLFDGLRPCQQVPFQLSPSLSFHYYHPEQGGSASMKAVLPALTGKAPHRVVLGLVDHLPGLSHLDPSACDAQAGHPGLAEGAPEEVLDQALHPFPVAAFQPHALVHAEAGVFPRTDVCDDLLGDLALRQEQREHLLFPELEERLDRQLGQRQERAAKPDPSR